MRVSIESAKTSPSIEEIFETLHVPAAEDGVCFHFKQDPAANGLSVKRCGGDVEIAYSETVYCFRAIGLVVEHEEDAAYAAEEHPRFRSDGAMFDCSRNGVLAVQSVKTLIRRLALMGLDTLMLYTEDTYQIGNNPYFGYMRGRYTPEELHKLDEYAAGFGVEIVPCIETLAHLQAALRWDAYSDVHDIDDILLADEPKTYAFLEEMIKACRKAFRTKRIHVGMDEAEHLGRGRYFDRHGTVPPFDIMCRYLAKVVELCKKYDFEPMMWSDMFFKMAGGGYDEGKLSDELLEKVPADVGLVYWDYHLREKERYAENIKKHQAFPKNPTLFAGGAWKWIGYAPNLDYSLRAARVQLAACAENGVSDVLITAWGDNGAEASAFTVLPVLQLYAEMNFHPDVDDETLAARFFVCTGGRFRNFMELDLPNRCEPHDGAYPNPSKYLLYQDPVEGLFDRHVGASYPQYFEATADVLAQTAKEEEIYGYLFETLAALCRLDALKSALTLKLKPAYDRGDKAALRAIATGDLPAIAAAAEEFKKALEAQWFRENKAFGFEVLDIRVGGVATRARSAAKRIQQYLSGKIGRIEELEEDRLFFDGRTEPGDSLLLCCNGWSRIATACNI